MSINNKIEGFIKIKATDSVTGKVRVVNKSNVLTTFTNNYYNGPANYRLTNSRIGLITYPIAPDNSGVSYSKITIMGTDKIAQSAGDIRECDTVDMYGEVTIRFPSDGSSHDIYGIALVPYAEVAYPLTSVTSANTHAYAALPSVFTQGASEVLDITYRVSANTNVLDKIEAYKLAYEFTTKFISNMTGAITTLPTNTGSSVSSFYGNSVKLFKQDTGNFNIPSVALNKKISPTYTSAVITASASTKYIMPRALGKTDSVGNNFYGAIGGTQGSLGTLGELNGDSSFTKHSNIIPDTSASLYPNYPVMPLFSHNDNAKSYFEDVGELASGLGYPVVSSTTNTDVSYFNKGAQCDNHTFKITKTGSSGNARFEYRVEAIYGSADFFNKRSNFTLRHSLGARVGLHQDLNQFEHIDSMERGLVTTKNPLFMIKEGFYLCGDTNVTLNKQAFSVISVVDLSYFKVIDTLTTPALPSTNLVKAVIRTVCGSSNSDEFFYINTVGLIKVTGLIAGTPVTTSISNSTIGLTTKVLRAIRVSGNTLTTFNDDGMAFSRDNGATWTVYTFNIPPNTNTTIGINSITMCDDHDFNMVAEFSPRNTSRLMVVDPSGTSYSATTSSFGNLANILTPTAAANVLLNSTEQIKHVYINKLKIWVLFKKVSSFISQLVIVSSDFTKVQYKSISDAGAAAYDNFVSAGLHFVPNKLGGVSILGIYGKSTTNFVQVLFDLELETLADSLSLVDQLRIFSGDFSLAMESKRITLDDYSFNGLGVQPEVDSQNPLYSASLLSSNFSIPSENSGNLNQHKKSDLTQNSKLLLHTKNSILQIHRNNSGTLELDYNKPTPATADGSSTLTGIRYNFDTDSNDFYYNRLDLSPATNSASYNTNGFTFIANVTPTAKDLTAIFLVASKVYPDIKSTCIMELYDTINGGSIALMQNDYDSGNSNTVLIDNTDPTNIVTVVLEVAPALSANRYAISINSAGNTVKVYRQGTQIGSNITLTSSIVMNSTYELSVGCRNRCSMDVTNYGSNFKGAIANILVYNSELSLANIASDAGAPLGLAIPANLVVRYLMTADYNEGTLCDTITPVVTPFGMDIKFPDGDLSNPSYIKDDYYNCFKSKYSFIKDNVTTVDLDLILNTRGDTVDTLTSPIDGTSVIPAADAMVTAPASFGYYLTKETASKGQVVQGAANIYHPIFETSLNADYTLEWAHTFGIASSIMRIGDVTDLNVAHTNDSGDKVGFRFKANGAGIFRIANTGIETDLVTTYAVGDKFKLDYVQATSDITLYKWDGTAWVSLSVTNVPNIVRIGSVLQYTTESGSLSANVGIHAVKVTYLHPKEYMQVGDKTTSTGAYDSSRFCRLSYTNETYSEKIQESFAVFSNGVINTATFIKQNSGNTTNNYYLYYMGKEAPLAVGEVICNIAQGYVRFSPSDVGKSITCNTIHYVAA